MCAGTYVTGRGLSTFSRTSWPGMRLNALKGFLMRSAEPAAAAAEASSASIPAEICLSEVTCPRANGLASPRCAGKRAADATEACVATSASTSSAKARDFIASVGCGSQARYGMRPPRRLVP